jgi:hypothetical protein
MMTRLISVGIFAFCGTMTALLVRSVYFPEESRLATVPLQAIVELITTRDDSSMLDIYDGARIIGECTVNATRFRGVKSNVEKAHRMAINARLRTEPLNESSPIFSVKVTLFMESDGSLHSHTVGLMLPVAGEVYKVDFAKESPSVESQVSVTKGDQELYRNSMEGTLNPAENLVLQGLLRTVGVSTDAFTQARRKAQEIPMSFTARAGRISADGKIYDGYVLTLSQGGPETALRFYVNNNGEIVRVATPLQYELLAQSMRDPEAIVPDLSGIPEALRKLLPK